ncbi:MAG TPA: 4-alpha-glucanotransferase [Dysgonamonadaceae bacterium]|nr:4-alpha-glucanotransferase [Dysgonamonadaceae bacterium]
MATIHIQFNIEYYTRWGQEVCICGSIPELGMWDENKALELATTDGHQWSAEITPTKTKSVAYYYFIREGGTTARREWGTCRLLETGIKKIFFIEDHWKDKPSHQYLYSKVFTESVFAHEKNDAASLYKNGNLLLNVLCPYVEKNMQLVISGESDGLGNWDLTKAPPLTYVGNGEWEIVLNAEKVKPPTAYKFVIIDVSTKKAIRWEDGDNRLLYFRGEKKDAFMQVEMAIPFRYAHYVWKGCGVAIPVFSLRSEESYGIGDFNDLKKMIDWAATSGLHIVQLLPINDTTKDRTRRDSYPYSAISVFALHPIYLGLSDFPLKDAQNLAAYESEAKKLNALKKVDYEKALRLKWKYCRELFRQEGENVLASTAYRAFYKENESWLFPYSCYCYLRDKYNSVDFEDWHEFAHYDDVQLKRMLKQDKTAHRETDFYSFMQYLLHCQLSEVKEYAHKKGVALKGDIPIGVHRHSVEVWTNPELFNRDTQMGAPPDDFSVFGQNWGFPTYNWPAMEKENYAWWKRRFQKMADYFDAYRIDHILGFFRIWEIPTDAVQGLLGQFSPALPYTSDELVAAGIPFDEERMAEPFIHENFLSVFFGEYTEEVTRLFLDPIGKQQFRLKSFCNTQLKIKNLFRGHYDAKAIRIRNGLTELCAEVLFVRDRQDPNKFHPRIAAQFTYSYRYLDNAVKQAYNRLYDDFFYHKHNDFWREQAMKKLPPLISATSMMACGEDLGMVPQCVPSVMQELQILSLEIQRMPKTAHTLFSDLKHLPYLSVCTTSTHDMSPIRAWWEENKEVTQRYYNLVLGHEGEAPDECTPELCREILELHLQSSSLWVIIPWQDWIAIDGELRYPDPHAERINIPANPKHYWQYRMHISLDDLLKADRFNAVMKEMTQREK